MRPDNQHYNLEFLKNNFTYSSLWLFYNDLVSVRNNLNAILEKADLLHDFKKARKTAMQLNYVDENLDRIQFTLTIKECDFFEFLGIVDVSLN